MVLVSQGQVIREEDLVYEVMGEGEDREALFKVRAARYAVSPTGAEVKLDQVLGVKRQPMFYEPQVLDLDTRVPSKKYKGKTYRELLGFAEGRDYLAWMAESFNEPEIRAFVVAILSGEEIVANRGRQLNPHWYEAGAMKAARNARFRLIPADTKAIIMARARQTGQAKTVERDRTGRPMEPREGPPAPAPRAAAAAPAPGVREGPYAPSVKQIAFYQRQSTPHPQPGPFWREHQARAVLALLALLTPGGAAGYRELRAGGELRPGAAPAAAYAVRPDRAGDLVPPRPRP